QPAVDVGGQVEAALGRALDQWCADQGTPGTPDRLQAHLATLFHDQLPLSVAPAPGRSVPRTNSGR
ncbi:MAG: hypothetical protein ACO327_04240, partial [Gemmatimonadaceae bacterium]